MYWDIVEVKPELDYCLFVRFKEGLTGRVRLRREELTGAIAPLHRHVARRDRSGAVRDVRSGGWPSTAPAGVLQKFPIHLGGTESDGPRPSQRCEYCR